jgi:hypothetical protein
MNSTLGKKTHTTFTKIKKSNQILDVAVQANSLQVRLLFHAGRSHRS